MKRKMILMVVALLWVAFVAWPIAEAKAATRNATGSCSISRVGKCVTFSGRTSSCDNENTIRVTVVLQEYRDGVWYSISSRAKTLQNSDFVSTTKDYTVTGGHYYRVYASHYAKTGDVVSSSTSYTASTWIPN